MFTKITYHTQNKNYQKLNSKIIFNLDFKQIMTKKQGHKHYLSINAIKPISSHLLCRKNNHSQLIG